MWFEVLFVRSNLVSKLKGGVSGLMRAIVDLFFCLDGHDVGRSGILLKLPTDVYVQVFLKLGIVIADEAALHIMFVCKGAGGLKPCLLCQNVFNTKNTRGIVASDGTGWAVAHDCTESAKLVLHTRATIDAICRRLAAAHAGMSKPAFAELRTRLGWNFIDGSLMETSRHRAIADPTSIAMYDWMHVFFVQGVFNIHLGLLMQTLIHFNISYSMLEEYMDLWHWPHHLESRIATSNGVAQLEGERCLQSDGE